MKAFADEVLFRAWKLTWSGRPLAEANISVHTEALAREDVFVQLEKFCSTLHQRTGAKPVVAATTPRCPKTAAQMKEEGLDEAGYSDRLHLLARHALIGYHGHFFREGLEAVTNGSAHGDIVSSQFNSEMEWLLGEGLEPGMYVGGFWLMSPYIAHQMEASGLLIDGSFRYGQPDTFGNSHLPERATPRGRAFMLPHSARVVSIPNGAGFSWRSWRLLRWMEAQNLPGGDGPPLRWLMPFHDFDLVGPLGRVLWANLRRLGCQGGPIAWASAERLASEPVELAVHLESVRGA